MDQENDKPEETLQIEQLDARSTFLEIVYGTGITIGLGLLWMLEAVRDGFFRWLDRLNVRPRARRASAFPPGRPRRHTTADSRR